MNSWLWKNPITTYDSNDIPIDTNCGDGTSQGFNTKNTTRNGRDKLRHKMGQQEQTNQADILGYFTRIKEKAEVLAKDLGYYNLNAL